MRVEILEKAAAAIYHLFRQAFNHSLSIYLSIYACRVDGEKEKGEGESNLC